MIKNIIIISSTLLSFVVAEPSNLIDKKTTVDSFTYQTMNYNPECEVGFKGNPYNGDIWCSVSELSQKWLELESVDGLLIFSENTLKNVDNLKNLKKIGSWMSLIHNQLENINGLSQLKDIHYLNISHNQLKNIDSLKGIKKFYFFDASYNQLENIDGLSNLEQINDNLVLSNNKIKTLTPLSLLNKVDNAYLMFGNNELKDINGLEKIKEGLVFDFYNNKINNLEGLKNLEKITYLGFKKNELYDLKGLENLNTVYHVLDISFNKIKNLNDLKNLYFINTLYVNNNELKDISALNNVQNAHLIQLSNNNLEHLIGLENLTKIDELFLDNNKLENLNSLRRLKKVELLSLRGNPLKDISAICGLRPIDDKEDIIINIDDKEINKKCSEYSYVCGNGKPEHSKFRMIDETGAINEIHYFNVCSEK